MNKILLMHYLSGSGGKFISNCLTYSGQVVFPNYNVAKKYIETNDINVIEQALLKTIPEKSQSRQWLFLEQGCCQLFGNGIGNIQLGTFVSETFNDTTVFGDRWLPIMCHYKGQYDRVSEYFQSHQVFKVLVQARPEFTDFAIRLKWPESHHCLDTDHLESFNQEIKDLSFDHVITDWDPRDVTKHVEITKLANAMGVDYDLQSAENYIKKYLEFHQ